MITQTHDPANRSFSAIAPHPGVVQVWAPEGPVCRAIAADAPIVLGREGDLVLGDRHASRRHCLIAREGESWVVEDLGSHNGTYVAGERVLGRRMFATLTPLRVGECLFMTVGAVDAFADGVDVSSEGVVGPTLREVWRQIEWLARRGDNIHVRGPTGSGKELAARLYHRSSPRSRGPFIAVNCATIPEGIAERLLFGAVRGAYTGATETTRGYLQAADEGTLFLDEVGELDSAVQGKLLRTLETWEVCALGSTRLERLDLRICFATHRDLRLGVEAQRFRQDLYYRINNPAVDLPPLCRRQEEIPFLIWQAVQGIEPGLKIRAEFVQECLLRPWPGNIRELLSEVAAASRRALLTPQDRCLDRPHLAEFAGIVAPVDLKLSPAPIVSAERLADRDQVLAALRAARGQVSGAARILNVHRNQLSRWLDRNDVDARSYQGEH